MSAGQKSRLINIRYIWIKDQTKALEIDVRHSTTLSILADFFTKPMNGSCLGGSEMLFLDTNLLALFEKFCTQMSRSMLEIIMCDS